MSAWQVSTHLTRRREGRVNAESQECGERVGERRGDAQ